MDNGSLPKIPSCEAFRNYTALDSDGTARCDICRELRQIQELNKCTYCRPLDQPQPYFCERYCGEDDCGDYDCGKPNHMTCWNIHLPQKNSHAQAHQRIDALSDLYVNYVTHSEEDQGVQAMLHEHDRFAKWFMVEKESSSGSSPQSLYLNISNRFRQLCEIGTQPNRTQYPSFVSFIGDTCVGKSTLIRSMILMGRVQAVGLDRRTRLDPQPRQYEKLDAASTARETSALRGLFDRHGPVTRAGSDESLSDPTTSGVHLYKDPTHSDREYGSGDVPLLFVDCEGFRADTATPNAERVFECKQESRSPSPGPHKQKPSHRTATSPTKAEIWVDRIPITSPQYKGRGKVGIETLYARFLYAFSDVVVFVMKEDTQIQNDMRRVLEWAVQAVNSSINQRPQRTLIIVRNMPGKHSKLFYQEDQLKNLLLGNMNKLWLDSEILRQFKQDHDEHQSSLSQYIYTNQDLMNALFQSTRLCYIPFKDKAPTTDLFDQYQQLRLLIVDAVKDSQLTRAASWTQYSVATMTHLLNKAFRHFATLPTPFDFYTAARKDNPTPSSMDGHIALFIRHMQEHPEANNQISKILSAGLITYVNRGMVHIEEPQKIWDNTIEPICKAGLGRYRGEHQPCGFTFRNLRKCVAFQKTHVQHHDGLRSWAAGEFQSAGSIINLDQLLNETHAQFIAGLKSLHLGENDTWITPAQREMTEFRRKIFVNKQTKELQLWARVYSNKTCLTCLQAPPDHILPCGHGYCGECAQDFGEQSSNYECAVFMAQCILCEKSFENQAPQVLSFKPRCAGVRILTLDGGGVRGIVELMLLEEISRRTGIDVPIHDLFDLIVGTSTGGIIALGLALKRLSVKEMQSAFRNLATRTFRHGREGILNYIDPFNIAPQVLILFQLMKSRYRTTPLREGLTELFGESQSLFSFSTIANHQRPTRVAVTSTCEGNPWIITNYSRPSLLPDPKRAPTGGSPPAGPGFEREDDPLKEIKVWEAALATSAAPYYFKPFQRNAGTTDSKIFYDGALHANLPVPLALQEMDRVWPSEVDATTKLDCLVSVGTGIQKREVDYPNVVRFGGFDAVVKTFFNTINTEKLWQQLLDQCDVSVIKKLLRVNVPISEPYVSLDSHEDMERMEKSVKDAASSPIYSWVFDTVALQLIAALLFFEPDNMDPLETEDHHLPAARRRTLKGSIRCRLPRNSDGLLALAQRIVGFQQREKLDGQYTSPPQTIQYSDNDRERVRGGGERFRIACTISTDNPSKIQEVTVTFKDSLTGGREAPMQTCAISGFPVTFNELEKKARTRRKLWD